MPQAVSKSAPPSVVLILFARMRFPKALSHMSKKRRARKQAVARSINRLFTRAALCQSGMNAAFEVLDDVFAGAQRERHDGDCRRLVGGEREDARIADVEVRRVVALRKTVSHGSLGVLAETACAGLVQAVAWRVRIVAAAPDLAARPANDLGADLLRVLPHHQFVRPPVEVESRHGDPEDVFHFGVDVEIVARRWQRRRLYLKADRRRVIAANVALELRTEALELLKMPREGAAAAVRVNGVTANELLLEWAFQVLPAGHPDDGRVGDIVGRGRLPDQLRQEAVGRGPIKVIADVSAHLAARIGDAGW